MVRQDYMLFYKCTLSFILYTNATKYKYCTLQNCTKYVYIMIYTLYISYTHISSYIVHIYKQIDILSKGHKFARNVESVYIV
jgi:hypothetical protein